MYPFKEMNDAIKKRDQITLFGGNGVNEENNDEAKEEEDEEEEANEDDGMDGMDNEDDGLDGNDDPSKPLLVNGAKDPSYGSAKQDNQGGKAGTPTADKTEGDKADEGTGKSKKVNYF